MDPDDLATINTALDADVDRREKIKDQVNELDKTTRSMVGVLNKIHSTPENEMVSVIRSVRPLLESCSIALEAIANLVPQHQFWRWRDMWCHSLRTAVFSAALLEFLEKGKLISVAHTSEILGIKPEWNERLYLQVEDYLHGLISVVNELSRLAVNSVTMGDFDQPIRISMFVKDLFAGFSMLNLKNNDLRRRFDSLKYDIKKIEEVVYDISLRRLAPLPPSASEEMETSPERRKN
ncbi:Translin [Rickenella mellea]|uniref:Translin n=1 Tax=Rickenella mellea TaxID=50990 RepID=A0A4Y7Q4T3_9AGAM|nr:Translin [Rickenella mellea]